MLFNSLIQLFIVSFSIRFLFIVIFEIYMITFHKRWHHQCFYWRRFHLLNYCAQGFLPCYGTLLHSCTFSLNLIPIVMREHNSILSSPHHISRGLFSCQLPLSGYAFLVVGRVLVQTRPTHKSRIVKGKNVSH